MNVILFRYHMILVYFILAQYLYCFQVAKQQKKTYTLQSTNVVMSCICNTLAVVSLYTHPQWQQC